MCTTIKNEDITNIMNNRHSYKLDPFDCFSNFLEMNRHDQRIVHRKECKMKRVNMKRIISRGIYDNERFILVNWLLGKRIK